MEGITCLQLDFHDKLRAMFNFFKKKSPKRLNEHIALVKRICQLLPKQYSNLFNQIDEGIIRDVRTLDKPYVNYKRFSLDVDLLNKYENKAGRCFLVRGVSVYDTELDSFVEVRLVVAYGILLGYSSPSVSDVHADIEKVNVGSFYIEYFGEEDYNRLKSVFSPAELKLINPADVYEIELKGKVYYHIKDLEDGDFVGIDTDKNVFKITHDPFEVIKLNENLSEVLQMVFPERSL